MFSTIFFSFDKFWQGKRGGKQTDYGKTDRRTARTCPEKQDRAAAAGVSAACVSAACRFFGIAAGISRRNDKFLSVKFCFKVIFLRIIFRDDFVVVVVFLRNVDDFAFDFFRPAAVFGHGQFYLSAPLGNFIGRRLPFDVKRNIFKTVGVIVRYAGNIAASVPETEFSLYSFGSPLCATLKGVLVKPLSPAIISEWLNFMDFR